VIRIIFLIILESTQLGVVGFGKPLKWFLNVGVFPIGLGLNPNLWGKRGDL
jgi:hypothetical protein